MALPALFIGRFQPFHCGHFDALAQIFKREKKVIIAIGSAENSRTAENPFTAGERYQMIEAALGQAGTGQAVGSGKQFAIIPIRDINNYSKWVEHIESLLPPFGAVYSGSEVVKKLFKEHGRHKVHTLTIRKKISATLVREQMRKKQKWGTLVPAPVAGLLKKFLKKLLKNRAQVKT